MIIVKVINLTITIFFLIRDNELREYLSIHIESNEKYISLKFHILTAENNVFRASVIYFFNVYTQSLYRKLTYIPIHKFPPNTKWKTNDRLISTQNHVYY